MPPNWVPRGVELEEGEKFPLSYKYNPIIPKGLSLYATTQFLIAAVLTMLLLIYEKSMSMDKYLFATFIVFSLVNIAGIFDKKNWAIQAEIVRLYTGIPLFVYFMHEHALFIPLALTISLLSVLLSFWVYKYKSFQLTETTLVETPTNYSVSTP